MSQSGQRDALRLVSYGLYVLTTAHGSEINAIVCNWLTQISFEPLMLVVALENESHSHLLVQESGVFAINFLDKDQIHLARRLAAPHRINPHKLVGVAYHTGLTGTPLLDQAMAFLECEVRQALEVGGDHTLFVGEVVGGEVTRHAESLTLLASGLRYK
jgi:flavin reductase (DIM6/NTAB) family NADH-FMN oxidoreductase RutF